MGAEFRYHNMQVDESRLIFSDTPTEAVDQAHALVVLTEWDEFKTYPYDKFYESMMKPAFLFDGHSILDHSKLETFGFEVHAIGKGRGSDGKLRVLSKTPTAVATGALQRPWNWLTTAV